jgi:DnaJ-class molecular chaperone
MENNDFYKVLGVSPDADAKAIKNAFRTLALKYHPDRNQDNAEASEKMKQINEAYAVLSDPAKRSQYDGLRSRFGSSAYQRFRQTHTEQDIFSGSDINTILEELARSFGIRGFDALFKEIYGQGYQTFAFKKPGFSARGFVFTGPFGARRTVQGQDQKAQIPSMSYKILNKLSRYAAKKITGVDLPENGVDVHDVIRLSAEQMKGGGPYAYSDRKKSRKIVVKIPPDIKEGQRIRLKGMGETGAHGGQSGDLFLKVRQDTGVIKRVKAMVKDLMK